MNNKVNLTKSIYIGKTSKKPMTDKTIQIFIDLDYYKPEHNNNVSSYKGFTINDNFWTLFIGKYTMHGDSYSYGFMIDNEQAIISYCERDIFIKVYKYAKDYEKAKQKAINFYLNEL